MFCIWFAGCILAENPWLVTRQVSICVMGSPVASICVMVGFSAVLLVRRVMGHYDSNDTMLRRSDQLFLTPENDHFGGNERHPAKAWWWSGRVWWAASGQYFSSAPHRPVSFLLCMIHSKWPFSGVRRSWSGRRNIVSLLLWCPITVLTAEPPETHPWHRWTLLDYPLHRWTPVVSPVTNPCCSIVRIHPANHI